VDGVTAALVSELDPPQMKTPYLIGKYPNQWFRRDKHGQAMCSFFGCRNRGDAVNLYGGICFRCKTAYCYDHDAWGTAYLCAACETEDDGDPEVTLLMLWCMWDLVPLKKIYSWE
jgi:hypothetical protein